MKRGCGYIEVTRFNNELKPSVIVSMKINIHVFCMDGGKATKEGTRKRCAISLLHKRIDPIEYAINESYDDVKAMIELATEKADI